MMAKHSNYSFLCHDYSTYVGVLYWPRIFRPVTIGALYLDVSYKTVQHADVTGLSCEFTVTVRTNKESQIMLSRHVEIASVFSFE